MLVMPIRNVSNGKYYKMIIDEETQKVTNEWWNDEISKEDYDDLIVVFLEKVKEMNE